MKLLTRFIPSVVALALPLFAQAQCQSNMTPSCGVYDSCFAKYCPCPTGPDEYFISYGKKYCERFLGSASFGPAGIRWRDATLVCLQEKIVPHLDISTSPKCNCKAMKDLASMTHVACYTQAGASICDLPLSDVVAIQNTVEWKEKFSGEGITQMHQVSKICAGAAPDDGRRAMWKALETFFGTIRSSSGPSPPTGLTVQ